MFCWICLQEFEVIAQRFAGHIGKRWCDSFTQSTVVAQCTHIHLPVARKVRGVQDRLPSRCGTGPGFLSCHVLGAWTMAPLAGASSDQTVSVITIGRRILRERSDVGRMALQATGVDGPREVSGTVFVAGTINPPMPVRPVAYRQLKQLVALPIKVGRSPDPGASDDVYWLGSSLLLSAPAGHGGFIVVAVLCFHLEIEKRPRRCSRIDDCQDI